MEGGKGPAAERSQARQEAASCNNGAHHVYPVTRHIEGSSGGDGSDSDARTVGRVTSPEWVAHHIIQA